MSVRVAGLDIGDKFIHICVLGEDNEVEEQTKIRASQAGVRGWATGRRETLAILEVGTHSRWVAEVLGECGVAPLVANARHLRLIYGRDNKTDRTDAEILARVGKLDPILLHAVSHRGRKAQEHLAIVRARNTLVEARAKLVNHIRGVVKGFGTRLPSCSTEAFAKPGMAEILPKELLPALEPLLDCIAKMTARIQGYDREITRLGREEYQETQNLQAVCGVGPLVALAFVLTIEDPNRFAHVRSIGAFLGLVRKLDQSGDQDKQLGITKAGDIYLRKLLVQSAHHILGPFGKDSDLRRWGLKLAERGGRRSKQRAVVAVARKLAVLLLTLWKTGEEYHPLHQVESGTGTTETETEMEMVAR